MLRGVESAAGPELELPDFLDYIDHNLNPSDEDSVLKCHEKLQGLARNRRFLAELLIETLTAGDTFQPNNPYAGPVILLSEGKGYAVRAVAWPPSSKVDKTPSNRNAHVFADSADAMMHSHNMGILTVGYAGPGYVTCRCDWLEFSRLLGESRFIPVVESVSARHPSLRVRSRASNVLRSLEERRGLDSSVALEEASQLPSTEKGEPYAD